MDVFSLAAKITLDKSEYESGVNEAQGSFSKLASGVGNGLKTVAKVGATAVAAGAAGVAALTKMGVEGFAQYEQLVGGVETLFKESGNAVMKYAENAYKTSGLSANAYMETVTSFSASLIQSLDGDTAKAAEVADMAITDMADNANKMGTSIEMIQNAYNGFAKGNFTMLDNLKLGYGGTQEEMKRLLADAEKLSGVKYDISSFADISEAIHVMQQEMGLAGATAKEAATTIEGSLGMMKGAWENLVVGMADENADMELLIGNFVESTATAAQNLLPRIEQTLQGIGSLVENMAPIISEALPVLIESVLPSLLSAGVQLIVAIAKGIIEAAPALYESLKLTIFSILTEVFGVTQGEIDSFLGAVSDAIGEATDFLKAAYSSITEAIGGVVQGFKDAAEWCKEHETTLTLVGIAIGTVTAAIIAYNTAMAIKNAGGIAEIAQLGILQVQLWGLQAAEIATTAAKWLATTATTAYTAATTALGAAMTFLTSPITLVVLAIGALIAIVVLCVKHWDDIKAAGAAAWEWICNAWNSAGEWFNTKVVQPIVGFFSGLWDGIKNGASQAWNALKNGAAQAWEGIKSVFSVVTTWFRDVFSKAWQAVKNVFSTGGKVFDGIKEGIVSVFKTVVNAIIGGINKVISVPFNSINNVLNRIRSISIAGLKPFSWIWTLSVPQIPKLSTGLKYVPYDEYPAFLHRGEAVLTAAEARAWRNGQARPATAGGITINQYIQTVPQTPVEFAQATEAYFEQAGWAL